MYQAPSLPVLESWVVRSALPLAILFSLLIGSARAQSNKKLDPDAGYTPTVAPDKNDKKKKGADVTQALALPPELPAAVTAETSRLAFQVTPLSAKGLLSQQTRDAIKGLLRSNHGPIVKLRAFVAGSGDLRRIGEIAGEMFLEKRMPLPALTVVQVGALPMVGAQVAIEATEVDRKIVNPSGVAFVAAQPAPSVAESLAKLKSALAGSGIEPSDALIVTCFVSSLDDQRDTQQAMSASFPGAALDYVQMQRAPVQPAASCEATARLKNPASSGDAQVAQVSSPQVILTGTRSSGSSACGEERPLRWGGLVASLRDGQRIGQSRTGAAVVASRHTGLRRVAHRSIAFSGCPIRSGCNRRAGVNATVTRLGGFGRCFPARAFL